MKKIFLLFGVILTVIMLVGADLRQQKGAQVPVEPKRPCYGYTIIEFGKGINCQGDTIRLTRVEGGQVLAQVQ